MISGYSLRSAKHNYNFAEIEFYLYHTDHPDKSAHCNGRQLEYGHWYFHRYKNGNTKVGTRKGLDITFGDKDKNYHAGILIRALQNSNDYSDYIYGPSKVVDRILKDCNCIDINIEKSDAFKNNILRITQGGTDRKVFACPRHNLGKNTPKDYLTKRYRFFTYANKVHYGKKKVIIPCLRDKENAFELFKSEICLKTI